MVSIGRLSRHIYPSQKKHPQHWTNPLNLPCLCCKIVVCFQTVIQYSPPKKTQISLPPQVVEISSHLSSKKTPRLAFPKPLALRFHKTEVSKRYVCLVHGRVTQPSGLVDASIRTLRTDATTRCWGVWEVKGGCKGGRRLVFRYLHIFVLFSRKRA